MTNKFSHQIGALNKAPSVRIVTLMTTVFFSLGLFYAIKAGNVNGWVSDPAAAIKTTWLNIGDLYFGIAAPVLIGGIVATLMKPEQQRGNLQWIRSQPRGIQYLLREKVVVLALTCVAISVLQAATIVGLGLITSTADQSALLGIAGNAACSGFGMFAAGSFYLWVSTYTDSLASTLSIVVGVTVATLGVAIFSTVITGEDTIERVLPTSQIIATSFSRVGGETDIAAIAGAVGIALLWSVVFLWLTGRRLRRVLN